MNSKKVFVSGCFDMMHSGHIRFIEEASFYGDVYIGIGSDNTIKELKGRYPITTQAERQYMLANLKTVKNCVINSGSGIIDFLQELKQIQPDFFIVNEEGNTPAKASLCKELGIQYIILKRKPYDTLPPRSTTSLRHECSIPYRLDLAGGWLDQPFVSELCSGPVIGISIEPTVEFNERSGMASSTRRKAIDLWNTQLPGGDPEKIAKILFAYENPPGSNEIAGSQDAINIVMPGLTRSIYTGQYWPTSITNNSDEDTLSWIEKHLYLIPLEPRRSSYDVSICQNINLEGSKRLSMAADLCWNAILHKDVISFGKQMRASFEAQISMFPSMLPPGIENVLIKYHSQALGWKISGAGGGGYLILVNDKPIHNALQIKIRRKNC